MSTDVVAVVISVTFVYIAHLVPVQVVFKNFLREKPYSY